MKPNFLQRANTKIVLYSNQSIKPKPKMHAKLQILTFSVGLLIFLPALAPVIQGQFTERQAVIGEQRTIVILVELKDTPHFREHEYFKDLIFNKVSDYYRQVSNNLTWISGDLVGWYPINRTLQEIVDARSGDLFKFLKSFATQAIGLADKDADFSKYNRFVIIHSARRAVSGNTSYTLYGSDIPTNDGIKIDRLQIGASDDSFIVTVHEFGHNLGGLVDLYDARLFRERRYSSVFVGPWDVMSNDNRYKTPTFFAWNRIRFGWLPDSRIKDLKLGETAQVNLTTINIGTQGIQAIRVRTSPFTYYLAEVRLKKGFDSTLPSEGMIVTYINETVPFGRGPARVMDANPATATLDDAAFTISGNPTYIDAQNDISFIITKTSTISYSVSATTAQRGMLAQKAYNSIRSINQSTAEHESDQSILASLKKATIEYEKGNFEASLAAAGEVDPLSQKQQSPHIIMFAQLALLLVVLPIVYLGLRHKSATKEG